LLAAAAVFTLVAVFYTVENWRGRRAWQNCRRELEAKGEVLDWAAYIPTPVPDDQNIFKAPKMQEWFVRNSWGDLDRSIGGKVTNASRPFAPPQGLAPDRAPNLIVAEVRVLPAAAPLDSRPADAVLRLEDPEAPKQAGKLLCDAVGPCAIDPYSRLLVAAPLDQVKPVRLVLLADTVPPVQELAGFFPGNLLTNSSLGSPEVSHLRVDPAGSNSFRVTFRAPVQAASDCLAWTEPLTANFDLVRKALERPYARIEGDYERPFMNPIPNFIALRHAAQPLSQRAQCYLLLGQPEAAWHELALVRALCRFLEPNKPAGRPIFLVAIMVDAAITGLYTEIVEDGLRLRAWREPQLAAIEQQLGETDLLPLFVESLRSERAASCRTLEITKRSEIARLYFPSSRLIAREGVSELASRLGLTLMPRGWCYQNMAMNAWALQGCLRSVDLANHVVLPRQIDTVTGEILPKLHRWSPYTVLAAAAIGNFQKAAQALARRQAFVDQGRLACALERYRLAQGQYPEAPDALVPRFIEKIPHDIIGGQPLKYRRTEHGGYLLYSIGWDEKDGGGVPGKTIAEGDWVWPLQ
jgi:hypothetical protein